MSTRLQYPEVIRVAIDQEHVEHRDADRRRARDRAVPADDRGLSGERACPRPIVRIQAEDFDIAAEIAALTAQARRHRRGGHLLRSLPRRGRHGWRHSSSSTIPAWPRPRSRGSPTKRSSAGRCTGLTAIHRYGRIAPGENIVLVVAASAHRQAAFEAASFLMDYLKSRAPFWKKEERRGGEGGLGRRQGRRRSGRGTLASS